MDEYLLFEEFEDGKYINDIGLPKNDKLYLWSFNFLLTKPFVF